MTSVLKPQDMSPTLAAAFNARDLDATAAFYDEDAVGGEPLEGRSLEVLRRQRDGSWRYFVDCPTGDLLMADKGSPT